MPAVLACYRHHVSLLHRIFFDLEDIGEISLLNLYSLTKDYAPLFLRREISSVFILRYVILFVMNSLSGL
jgi:hypothetical protein